MAKNIGIFGSTGSIGCSSLDVINALGADYKVAALSAHSNVELLAEQVRKYQPKYAAVTNPACCDKFREIAGDYSGQILTGPESLIELGMSEEIDTIITAVVGAAGLGAALSATKAGKTLAIANKEPLVIAGKLLTETAKANGATILPVDSEHSAIFQIMHAGKVNEISKIILTASGGPFRGASKKQIEKASLEQALSHPTWRMGPKITVDSATMMNKALEIIEAVWLFGVSPDKIDVVVHPESIVHSLVEFVDGSVIAQMSTPDMTLPIQYALTYPKRVKGIARHLDLAESGKLTFERPDREVFRAIELGFEVAAKAGTAGAVFNAANEAAVAEFLEGNIKFARIVELIEHCVNKNKFDVTSTASLELLGQADAWARREVAECLKEKVS